MKIRRFRGKPWQRQRRSQPSSIGCGTNIDLLPRIGSRPVDGGHSTSSCRAYPEPTSQYCAVRKCHQPRRLSSAKMAFLADSVFWYRAAAPTAGVFQGVSKTLNPPMGATSPTTWPPLLYSMSHRSRASSVHRAACRRTSSALSRKWVSTAVLNSAGGRHKGSRIKCCSVAARTCALYACEDLRPPG